MGDRRNKLQNGLISVGQFQHALDEMTAWLDRADAALDEAAAAGGGAGAAGAGGGGAGWSSGDAKRIEIEMAKHKILANDIAAHQAQLNSLNAAAKQVCERFFVFAFQGRAGILEQECLIVFLVSSLQETLVY